MNQHNNSSSPCPRRGTHPQWWKGSHQTRETWWICLWLYFSICDNTCCRSINSLAWAFDSDSTIRVENVFASVVFTSSQLISPCPSVVGTLVTSRVTDIPRIPRETHVCKYIFLLTYSQLCWLARPRAAQKIHPTAVCYMGPDGRKKALLCIIDPNIKKRYIRKIILINLTAYPIRSKCMFLEGSMMEYKCLINIGYINLGAGAKSERIVTVSTYNESTRCQAGMFPVIAQPAFRYSPLSKDTICAGFQCLGHTSAAQPCLDSHGFSGLSDHGKQLWAVWGQARPQLTLKLPPTSYKYYFLLGMLWEELPVKKQHFHGLQVCYLQTYLPGNL